VCDVEEFCRQDEVWPAGDPPRAGIRKSRWTMQASVHHAPKPFSLTSSIIASVVTSVEILLANNGARCGIKLGIQFGFNSF
jgi:hypothetical protein